MTTSYPVSLREYDRIKRENDLIEREENKHMEPGFIHELKELMDEAKREGGKVEILFNHPDKVFIRVYGNMPRATEDKFQIRREVTHYL